MKKAIRILFLSANPDDTTKLKVLQECNSIDAKIQASEYRDQFHLQQIHAVSLLELQTHFLRFKPNIVHFSGHGSERGALVFENYEGSSEEAPPTALSTLFKIINEGALAEGLEDNQIHCVVLNACYSLKQAKAIAKYVDCVVGISSAIKDSSATNFASSFYQALAFGQSVKTAFDLGCNQLGLSADKDESILKLEHNTDVDPSKIFLVSNAKPTRPLTDVAIPNPEEAKRAENLSFHCTKLLSKLDLERFYLTLPSVRIPTRETPAIDPVRREYWIEFLQHVYTGQRKLYEAAYEYRKSIAAKDSEMGFVKESILNIFQELGYAVADESFRNRMAIHITACANKRDWEKFKWKKDHGKYFITWENGSWEIQDVDDERAENICSALNDFFLARGQLMLLHQRWERLGSSEKHYVQSINEFNTLIGTGATSLGGACDACLSSNFHDEKAIINYRTMLIKLQDEWSTSESPL